MIRSVVILAGLVPLLLIAGCTVMQGPFERANAPDSALEFCLETTFKRVDGNSDGVLDRAETAAPPMSLPQDFFERIDENQDGVIDRQEYENMEVFVRCALCPSVECPLGRSGKTGKDSTTR